MTGVTEATARTMTVAQLKQELVRLNLPTTGNKPDLLARLLSHLQESDQSTSKPSENGSGSKQATPGNGTEKAPISSAGKASATAPKNVNTIVTSDPTHTVPPSTTATGAPSSEPTSATEKNTSTQMSEEERRKARAARFGIPEVQPTPKTTKKAEPIGNGKPKPGRKELDPAAQEALRKRAERFGIPAKKVEGESEVKAKNGAGTGGAKPQTSAATKATPLGKNVAPVVNLDPETIKKRQERFGIVNPDAAKVLVRSEEEERKRKRAERFAGGNVASQDEGADKKQKV
ncbi:hypothetical protein BC832DRAFT_557006 [Gaertneriomyces semiglobifer]|nr:hypothetical protein BC832DRAFT_557006 [Gaertneriomyces semiglobifer]